ncbi:MAG: methyltransferase domain-containing protein [Candidatus Limnocylindrales bacterium]
MDLVRSYVRDESRILEIGCNVGRNLAFLFDAGYRDLTGIEINSDALVKLREAYPELSATAELINAPVEDVIGDLPDDSFDLVFAMAVLEHIHPDSDWIFGQIVRIARTVILTIEDEHGVSPHHVPRDYRAVFEPLGMRQVAEHVVSADQGFPTVFQVRVFEHRAAGA